MSKVSLVRGNNRYLNIYRSLELIQDDLSFFRLARKIIIKPNLTGRATALANTHPSAVCAVIEYINDNFSGIAGREFILLEGSGEAHYGRSRTLDVFKRFGFLALLSKYPNLIIKTIEEEDEFIRVPIETVNGLAFVRLGAAARHADCLVSLAIPKTHDVVIFTGGIKNLMGLLHQADKSLMHGIGNAKNTGGLLSLIKNTLPGGILELGQKSLPGWLKDLIVGGNSTDYLRSVALLNRNLVSLVKSVRPTLTILDGFTAMEGDGPVYGRPLNLKLASASTDSLKADCLGARLLGFDPLTIGYLNYLSRENFGDSSTEGLVGENWKEVTVRGRPHRKYEMQKNWRN